VGPDNVVHELPGFAVVESDGTLTYRPQQTTLL
jgi:hypothetical protein